MMLSLWLRYLADEATPEERRTVLQWLAKGQFPPEVEAWLETQWEEAGAVPQLALPPQEARRIRQAVWRRTGLAARRVLVTRTRVWGVAAVMGVLAGLAGLLWPMADRRSEPWQQVATLAQERRTVTLPDGSRVTLNALSTLAIDPKFGATERRVQLVGEAYFDVAKDPARPFVVEAGRVETTVLGTAFSVTAYADADSVAATVTEGRVQVQAVESNTPLLVLQPNQQGVVHHSRRQVYRREVPASEVTAWRDGRIQFRALPLEQLAPQLARWYGVPFRLANANVANCRLTGSIERETLPELVELLRLTAPHLVVAVQKGEVVISGGGCAAQNLRK